MAKPIVYFAFDGKDFVRIEEPAQKDKDWRAMCVSNDFVLAAYLITKGEPWSRYMPELSYRLFMKYTFVKSFRAASAAHRTLYLLMLARAFRHEDLMLAL